MTDTITDLVKRADLKISGRGHLGPVPEPPADPKRYALFIGRWQPPHPGHEWLIRQKLDQGVPCLVAVRPTDEWLTTVEVVARIEAMFEGEEVVVMVLPVDIESVNYGRGVGYGIVEHVPPPDIGGISGSEIRDGNLT